MAYTRKQNHSFRNSIAAKVEVIEKRYNLHIIVIKSAKHLAEVFDAATTETNDRNPVEDSHGT
jgi:hypothetical protein